MLKTKTLPVLSLFIIIILTNFNLFVKKIAIFGTMSYGFFKSFPIAAYGDSYLLYLQAIIVLVLVLFYQRKYCSTVLLVVISAAAAGLLYIEAIPEAVIIGLNGKLNLPCLLST